VQGAVPAMAFSNAFGHSGTSVFYLEGAGAYVPGIGGVDPQFVDISSEDPLLWDLHLQGASGLIHAGDPSILNPDGSQSDIGAYGGPLGDW
jgi:hypothetical protein